MFQLGTVHTDTIRSWDKPSKTNIFRVPFPIPHPTPPLVITGLNTLDTNNWQNARIDCDIQEVLRDSMVINMRSWWDTTQYRSGCSWLVPPSTDTDFQHGHFDTREDHPWQHRQQKTSRRITFERRYAQPPQVVVGLRTMNICNNANFRLKTFATDIGCDGFTLHVDTWGDTTIQCAGVFWAAHSAGRKDICSGTFGTDDTLPWAQPRRDHFKALFFRGADFGSPPRVFLAFNSIDVDNHANLRFKMYATQVMSSGMIWHIDTWDNTVLYGAGGSFIAVP